MSGVIWLWVAAVAVTILSAARLTRLLTQDAFPPAAWIRNRADALAKDSDWGLLVHCHWCAAPWLTAIVGGWGLLSDFQAAWWVVNGWLAASYLASIVVHFDEGGK